MVCKSVICFLVLSLASVRGRVVIEDEALSEITNNVIDDLKLNTTVIHIDLPTVKPNDNVGAENTSEKSESSTPVGETNEDISTNTPVRDIKDNKIDDDDDSKGNEVLPEEDCGVALKLTQFIKENRLEEARSAAKVTEPEIFLGIESYTGFLTVNETYDSNLFFWYFPVEKKPVNETPWIIWLQGGPGASSMTGLFDEIGPFRVTTDNKLIRNPYSWLQDHSLLFIDNPVGTGYSFTTSEDGYVTDMDTYGAHLYTALQQFLQIFPELRTAPLFIAGESYAGKYVPSLAINIHRHKEDEHINLQGLITGNAYVDPEMISRMDRAFYNFGLLEPEQVAIVQPLLDAFKRDIDNKNSTAAKQKWIQLISALLFITHQRHAYNFLRDDLGIIRFTNFLQQPAVIRAMHTGGIDWSSVNATVNYKLSGEFLTSAKWIYEELLPHYRVLTYCGQLDLMMSCVATSENYRTWNWNGSAEFLQATRHPFLIDRKLAGYHKSGGHLTEVVIRGAGHMAPLDAPAPVQNLITSFTHDQPLSHITLLDTNFMQEFIGNATQQQTYYL